MKALIHMIIALMVVSCSNPEIKKLKGSWTIDSIEESGQDVMLQFTSNLISFKTNYECTFPQSRENNISKGKWILTKEDEVYYLAIKADGNKIAGKYRVDFRKETEKQLLIMYLSSDNTKIVCSKLLNSFADNE